MTQKNLQIELFAELDDDQLNRPPREHGVDGGEVFKKLDAFTPRIKREREEEERKEAEKEVGDNADAMNNGYNVLRHL